MPGLLKTLSNNKTARVVARQNAKEIKATVKADAKKVAYQSGIDPSANWAKMGETLGTGIINLGSKAIGMGGAGGGANLSYENGELDFATSGGSGNKIILYVVGGLVALLVFFKLFK